MPKKGLNFWTKFLVNPYGSKEAMKKGSFENLSFMFLLLMVVGCSRGSAPNMSTVKIEQTALEIAQTEIVQTTTPVTITPSATVELVPSLTPTPEVCTAQKGRVEFREFVTDILSYPFGLRVYVPPCYDFNTQERFPTLYMLHGQSFTDDQWDRLGADETADALISGGEAPPFIIVMPRENNYLEDDKVSLYGEAIVKALVPWIDEEYRTIPERECRSIGGISRGSAWSIRVGMTSWELFGAIGLHSFAPFPGDFYNFPYWYQEIAEQDLPRIYMDFGSTDGLLTVANLFEQRLTKYNVPHEWVINLGAHNEAYWSSHVEDYLLWYTFPWREICAPSNSTLASGEAPIP
jgi:enterochelin esterase-like enzyme